MKNHKKLCVVIFLCAIISDCFCEITDSAFNTLSPYALNWLVITATSSSDTFSCPNGTKISTTFFSELKHGLSVCVAYADIDKNPASKRLKEIQSASAGAYMRFSGALIEDKSVLLGQPIRWQSFGIKLNTGLVLTGEIDSLSPDAYALGRGIDAVYLYVLKSAEGKATTDSFSLQCYDRSVGVFKYQLDKDYVMIDLKHAMSDETIDYLTVWGKNGKIAYRETVSSVGEGADSYSETSIVRINGDYCIVTIIGDPSVGANRIVRKWNGTIFIRSGE
jgi:hypothetical protein